MLTRNEIKSRMTQPWTYYFTRGLEGEESQIVLKSQKSVNTGTQYESVVTTGGSCRNECDIHVKNPQIVQMHEFIEPTEKELDEYEVAYKDGLKSIANGDIYAFNDRGNPEELLLSKVALLHAKRFNLTDEEKEIIKDKWEGCCKIALMGCYFDFSDAESEIQRYTAPYRYEIQIDDSPTDPLSEYDNFFSFLSLHRDYYSNPCYRSIYTPEGEEFFYDEFDGVKDIEDTLNKNGYVWAKVYMYSHSGDTISSKPFGCRWDSGVFGYLYATPDEISKWYDTPFTDELKALAEKAMKEFIDGEWDAYVSGEVYGYSIIDTSDDEVIDSCDGYNGEEEATKAAKEALEGYLSRHYERTSHIVANMNYISALEVLQ